MTVKQLSEFFGKSQQTIRNHSKKIGIFSNNGKTKNYTKEEVEKLSFSLYKIVPLAVKESIDLTFKKQKGEPLQNLKVAQNDFLNGQNGQILEKMVDRLDKMQERQEKFFLAVLDKLNLNQQPKAISNFSHMTVKGYLLKNGIKFTLPEAIKYGREITKICQNRKIPIKKAEDANFGYINAYLTEILDEYFRA